MNLRWPAILLHNLGLELSSFPICINSPEQTEQYFTVHHSYRVSYHLTDVLMTHVH